MHGRTGIAWKRLMILMFYNDAFNIRWQAVRGGRIIAGQCQYSPVWPDMVAENIGGLEQIKAIGYFLHHGGQRIKKSAGFLTPQNFGELAKCVKFLPEYNDLTCKIAAYWLKKLPGVSHVLLCDTAFFTKLPYSALNYAIPYQLQRQEIRRYGRFGLSHHWITQQIQSRIDAPRAKVISVYLGDHTNISALNGKKPMATSFGFTPVDGMLSLTGSGSIDPTIVFYLHAAGMSFKEINELLSQKSGFAALCGKKAGGLTAVLNAGKGEKTMAARDFYCYNAAKWIGGFAAILGGVDVLVFFSERPEQFSGIIYDVCRRFAFLGLKCGRFAGPAPNSLVLSGKSSSVKVLCVKHSKWKVMEENIAALLIKRRTER